MIDLTLVEQDIQVRPPLGEKGIGRQDVVDGFGVNAEPLVEEQSVFLGGLVHIVDGRRALVAPLFHDKRMIADGVFQDDFARSLLEP